MVRTVLLSLLVRDVQLLLRLRVPSRTVTVLTSGLRLAHALRRGNLRLTELERLVGRIFLRSHVRDEHGIRYPIVDTVSLAEDVDTEEEARALARDAEDTPGRSPGD
jgi:hypothetical protein